VVTWESSGQDGSEYGIYAQRYDVNGNTIGNEFQVNTYVTDGQWNPDVTALTDGGFVIAWVGFSDDWMGSAVYAQRYDASGFANGAEFQVKADTDLYQFYPSITALDDGGFIIVLLAVKPGTLANTWDDNIYAQRYDSSGDPVGSHINDIMVGTSAIDDILAYGGNDTLTGDAGADQLDGGTGQDTMTGGTGNDTFVIRSGDGNIDINLADIITDFTDGEDLLGGTGNIDSFDQLTVVQGTGDNTADTVVSLTSTSEILAVLVDFTATDFDANDFVALDIV